MDAKVFAAQVREELQDNILPYWLSVLEPSGGCFPEVSASGAVDTSAPRGAILGARVVWAFSAAYHALGRPVYLDAARRACRYFTDHFVDPVNGGVYWSLSGSGEPLDTKKQLYSQGFAIYGLSEYYRASGDGDALQAAVSLFRTVEEHFRDRRFGGYREALSSSFGPLEDLSLSAHDINAPKTMNSHLHVLEAYANLYSVWPDEALGACVRELLDIVCGRIMGPDGHLRLYFTDDWAVIPGAVSYGHDIETAWLSSECARTLGDAEFLGRVERASRLMASAGNEGLRPDGSMIYETLPDGSSDASRQWWVQAETVVGNLWAWKHWGDTGGYGRSAACWEYIRRNLSDREGGEWFWAVNPDGTPDLSSPKAGFWKCPYHNTRMCLQVMSLLGE